jgi:hypothetical protein
VPPLGAGDHTLSFAGRGAGRGDRIKRARSAGAEGRRADRSPSTETRRPVLRAARRRGRRAQTRPVAGLVAGGCGRDTRGLRFRRRRARFIGPPRPTRGRRGWCQFPPATSGVSPRARSFAAGPGQVREPRFSDLALARAALARHAACRCVIAVKRAVAAHAARRALHNGVAMQTGGGHVVHGRRPLPSAPSRGSRVVAASGRTPSHRMRAGSSACCARSRFASACSRFSPGARRDQNSG